MTRSAGPRPPGAGPAGSACGWPQALPGEGPRSGDGQHVEDHPPCPPEKQPRHKPGSHGWRLGQAGTKHRPRRCSWFHCGKSGANGDRDYVAALNIGAEYLAEQAARREEAGHKKRGRGLAKAASAHRQGVSYTGASVARPFTSQNTRFPILSGRHGPRREKQGYRQWMRPGGGLCGWRGRHVRVGPKDEARRGLAVPEAGVDRTPGRAAVNGAPEGAPSGR